MTTMIAIAGNASQAIAHHNHEAEQAQRQALAALGQYNAAQLRLQSALARMDVVGAGQAEAEADAAWAEMRVCLDLSYRHRNSAAIAAGMAVCAPNLGGAV
ncbi:MAG: hypothetical protein AB1918_15920 [Pseudomonadota bacterium]